MNPRPAFVAILSALLAVPSSAALTSASTWQSTEDYCSETDYCCFKGTAEPKRECVRKDVLEVPTPDAAGMGEVRMIMKMRKKGGALNSEWGMADALGNTLIKPDEGRVIPLSTRFLLRCEKTCRVESPDAKPRDVGAVVDIPLLDGPPLHLVAGKDDKGRAGLAALRPDGTPGTLLIGAMDYGAQAMGSTVILRLFSEGKKGSVIVDALGGVLWAGPEIRLYGVINKKTEDGGDANGTKRYAALIPVGASPLGPLVGDGKLYQPLDQAGRPAKLPEGVLGVTPARLLPPPILDPKLSTGEKPDNVGAWLVVERKGKGYQYRIGGGFDRAPEHVLGELAKLPVVDEVTTVDRGNGYRLLAVHRVKENDWVVNPALGPGYGVTPEAAVQDMLLRQAAARAAVAAERERLQAEADRKASLARAERDAKEAELRARNLEYSKQFIPEFARPCVHDGGFHCRYVEEAAFRLGEPHLSEFLSHQGGFYSPVGTEENACAHGPAACAQGARLAQKTKEWVDAERQKQEDIKQFWRDARNYQLPQADVKVNYYEGGRLKQKTMSASEYRGVYGP